MRLTLIMYSVLKCEHIFLHNDYVYIQWWIQKFGNGMGTVNDWVYGVCLEDPSRSRVKPRWGQGGKAL